MPGERVSKQIPLDCEFIVYGSCALLKPVIHDVALVAKLGQRAAGSQRSGWFACADATIPESRRYGKGG